MVKVIFIKNPFQPSKGRVMKLSEVVGKPLSFYVGEFIQQLPEDKAYVQVNGRHYINPSKEVLEQVVPADAFIMVLPAVEKGGKNPLALIAAVALSVVSMGVGGMVATGTWGSFAGASAWAAAGGYLAAAAVMFVGGSLISKLGPKADLPSYQEEDPTYSWNGVQTMEGQGNGIAITYGTVKSGGQSIVKFTTNNGDDQYFNWLVCAGDGPLEITDVKLNDNPIENYDDVIVDIRPGTNNQFVIDSFNDTVQSKALGYELEDKKWRNDIADGNSAEGLIIDIECSQGLYHANDNGTLGTAWVDVRAECALEGTEDWQIIISGQPELKGNSYGIVLLNHDIDLGNYSVKVSFDNNKYRGEDENGDKIPNPHYQQYCVTVTYPRGKLFKPRYYGYFNPGDKGKLKVEDFEFDMATMEGQGAGFTTTLEVYQSGRITGSKAGPVRKQFRIDHVTAGKYKVRVQVIARSASVTSSRDAVKTFWTMLSTVVYDDFCYPNRALIGIKAKATSQLSGGTPKLTFLKTRANVWVFNPYLNNYEQKPADNPAWAAYDFLHGANKLLDVNRFVDVFEVRGIPAELMLYDQFVAWAENCDKLDLKINVEITSQAGFFETVNKEIAPVGRGLVLQFGTKFGCYFDHKSQPVQLFNMANIISGSFSLSYMGTEDRANAVEISFPNAEKNYERDTITIFGEHYDDADIVGNPTQIQMNGITSYKQAYREGMYQLMCNKLLQQTVSFKADVEAIGCMVGDVVLVSHDVPLWAYSGRITRVDGQSVVLLPLDPTEINMEQRYALLIRTANNQLYTYEVSSISGSYGSAFVTIAGLFDKENPPQPGDIFSLGKVDATAKPFVVKSITRSSEQERTISAVEYVEGVFEENYDIPQPDYSLSEDGSVENVINLQAHQVAYKDKSGQQLCKMYVSWQLPEGALADYFSILLSEGSTQNFVVAQSTMQLNAELDTRPFTEYYVKVICNYKTKQSSGTIVGPVAAGIDVPPPNVKILDHAEIATGTRRFYWEFEYPEPNDVAGFEIRYNQGDMVTWASAIPMHTGLITEQPFETQALRQGIHTVMICAVDNAGQYSEKPAFAILNLGEPLEDNVLYKDDMSANNWGPTVHNGLVQNDGSMVSKSNVAFWTSPDAPFWTEPEQEFWQERYSAFSAYYQAVLPCSGQMWLKYDITGPAKLEYRIVGKKAFWTSPDAPFWDGEADWAFWVDDTVMYKPYTGKVMVKAGNQIQVKVSAPENVAELTRLKKVIIYVDVPDREEHFENINVPIEGLELPIKTPHYYTTAVRLDAVQGMENPVGRAIVVSKNPCVIKLVDYYNNPTSAVVDVTWQGFVKEVL